MALSEQRLYELLGAELEQYITDIHGYKMERFVLRSLSKDKPAEEVALDLTSDALKFSRSAGRSSAERLSNIILNSELPDYINAVKTVCKVGPEFSEISKYLEASSGKELPDAEVKADNRKEKIMAKENIEQIGSQSEFNQEIEKDFYAQVYVAGVPEEKISKEGKSYVDFLAARPVYSRSENGDFRQEKSELMRIRATKTNLQLMSNLLQKGDNLMVQGTKQTNTTEDGKTFITIFPSALGFDFNHQIPSRLREAYGLPPIQKAQSNVDSSELENAINAEVSQTAQLSATMKADATKSVSKVAKLDKPKARVKGPVMHR
jgi:single-stranded DNA-binding protein